MASIHLFNPKPGKRSLTDLPTVVAPCPLGSGKIIELEISKSTISKLVTARRRTDLFQAWAHLAGEMPPVNNAELVRRTDYPDAEFRSLQDAHACFKGVKRQYDHDDYGGDIYVFVINTPFTVRWEPKMHTVVGYHPAPDGTLLTVQVRQRSTLHECSPGLWGAIAKWEFVNADRDQVGYPEGYDKRYDKLAWPT